MSLISLVRWFAAAPQITEQQLLGPVEFLGLHAVSKEVVWASGSGGGVYHTTTGGEHWTIDTIPGATVFLGPVLDDGTAPPAGLVAWDKRADAPLPKDSWRRLQRRIRG